MKLHHLKVKIYIGFMVFLLLIGIGTYIHYSSLKEVNGFLQEMYDEHYTASMLAVTQKARLSDVRAQLLAMTGEADKDKKDKYHARIKELSREIDDNLTQWFEKGVKVRDVKMNVLIRNLQTVWNEFRTTRDSQIIPFVYDGKIQEAKALAVGIQAERYKEMIRLADEVVKIEGKEARELLDISKETFKKLILFSIVASLVIVLIYLPLSYYTLRKDFSEPLADLSDHAKRMAEGHISHDIKIDARS